MVETVSGATYSIGTRSRRGPVACLPFAYACTAFVIDANNGSGESHGTLFPHVVPARCSRSIRKGTNQDEHACLLAVFVDRCVLSPLSRRQCRSTFCSGTRRVTSCAPLSQERVPDRAVDIVANRRRARLGVSWRGGPPRRRRRRSPPDEGLPKIAAATGGGYFELTSARDLPSTFVRVADEAKNLLAARKHAIGAYKNLRRPIRRKWPCP